MVAYCIGSDPIEMGDLVSKVKVTVTQYPFIFIILSPHCGSQFSYVQSKWYSVYCLCMPFIRSVTRSQSVSQYTYQLNDLLTWVEQSKNTYSWSTYSFPIIIIFIFIFTVYKLVIRTLVTQDSRIVTLLHVCVYLIQKISNTATACLWDMYTRKMECIQ